MKEQERNNIKIEKPVGVWKRILAIMIVAVFSFVFTFFIGIYFLPPTNFILAVFFITLFLGVILPCFPYRNLRQLAFVEYIVLAAWIVLCPTFLPSMIKTYRLNEAANIIPPYNAIQLNKIEYFPGSWPDNAPNVVYLYNSIDPSEDYRKIHDLYISQLPQKGYDVDLSRSTDKGVIFQKHNNASPTIWLGITGDKNIIEVSVSY